MFSLKGKDSIDLKKGGFNCESKRSNDKGSIICNNRF